MMQEVDMNHNTIIITMFVVMFGIIATVIGRNKMGIIHRLKAFFSSKRTYVEDKTEVKYNETLNTLLFTLIAIVSLGFIVICYANNVNVSPADVTEKKEWYTILGLVSSNIAVFLVLKSVVYFLVNSVFFSYESNTNWMSAYHFITSISALLLYPLALLAVFVDGVYENIDFCLILLLILYELLLFYKLYINFKPKKYSFLLIFLYFCTVELIPIMSVWHYCDQINRNFIV